MTAIPLVLSVRENVKKTIEEINQKCEKLRMPPAFEIGHIEEADSLDEIFLWGNLDK